MTNYVGACPERGSINNRTPPQKSPLILDNVTLSAQKPPQIRRSTSVTLRSGGWAGDTSLNRRSPASSGFIIAKT